MTATDAAPRRPEFWEETGSGFRLSVYVGPPGGIYWAEVHHESPAADSPMLYQSPGAATSEGAADLGRAFIAGAAFLASDAADAIADASGELGDDVEIATISLKVGVAAIRRLLGVA